ncbi:unnamed protein product [Calypogeia fissa]
MEEDTVGEIARKESEQDETTRHGQGERHVDFIEPHEEEENHENHAISNSNSHEVIPSHFRSSAKKQVPKRDIRSLNYAFGKPKIDDAAKEAQDWLDGLSIAEEEENNPKRNIFPHGLKYRSALANLSPQMLDRLQRCEENQEPYDPPKYPRIRCGERNDSVDVHVGLHEEDHCNRPNNVWKGRRTAAGNSSTSVYAILHPQAETKCYKRKKSPKKKPIPKRNHLREHKAAIAEMSFLTRHFKEKERKQEVERVSAVKHWGAKEIPKAVPKRQQTRVSINFVEKNMESVTEQSACVRALRDTPKPDVLAAYKENLGRVPEYLLRIKTELAQEAEHKAIEEAAKSIPYGRRLMSEVNRRHILQKLQNKHKELIATLKSFPLIFDTPRQIRIKSNIEHQLRNIEASYRYYDNPKVYTSCLDINCPTCMCLDNHFFRDSQATLSPKSHHDGDLWEHMACAAGIQRSPKRTPNREADGNNRSALGANSLTNKRRSYEGEFFTSPSKRQNTSPKKLFRGPHISSTCISGKSGTPGQTTSFAKYPR